MASDAPASRLDAEAIQLSLKAILGAASKMALRVSYCRRVGTGALEPVLCAVVASPLDPTRVSLAPLAVLIDPRSGHELFAPPTEEDNPKPDAPTPPKPRLYLGDGRLVK
jgi:hypothetical protein